MGGPKALLLAFGATLVEAHVSRLAARGYAAVVVVRAEIAPIVARLVADRPGCRVAPSDGEDTAASLAYGVAALPRDGVERVLVTPVDAHPVTDRTLDALEGAIAAGRLAATPRFEADGGRGRGGHPVVCRPAVLAPYLTARPPPPLRDVLRALGADHARVTVDDPCIFQDLDRPEDVAALTGAPPAFFR